MKPKCRNSKGYSCTTHLHCIRCGQVLDPKTAVWLEWDTRLGGPGHGPIPPEHSQGSFPYGSDCAKEAA